MSYSREIYDAAMAALERRRQRAVGEAAALRERVTAKVPRAREIELSMANCCIRVARAVLDGGDVDGAVEAIKSENLALQEELARLLAAAGESARDFEPRYTCPLCRDTGYAEGKICACLDGLLKEEACRRLSKTISMPLTSFGDLSLRYYPDGTDPRIGCSPREWMETVLDNCRRYAEKFTPDSPSLLLSGPTGTGKTHVSLAIARTAAEKGYGVIYGPAQVLLHRLEREHFGKAEGNSEEMMIRCDLLILDDLGTEFTGPFYISCLYNIINARMLERRPTIISTNCSQDELLDRYGEQITSRIIGTFEPVRFLGRDIRQMKAAERMR